MESDDRKTADQEALIAEQVSQYLATIITTGADLLKIVRTHGSNLPTIDFRAAITVTRIVTVEFHRRLPGARRAGSARDPELAAVLDSITDQLALCAALRGHERDDAYARLEAFAAPYAIAFYHEIAGLEERIAMLAKPPRPG